MTRWLMMLVAVALCGCPSEMDDMMMGDPMDMSLAEVDVYVPAPAPAGALRINHLQMRGTVDSYHAIPRFANPDDPSNFAQLDLEVQAREQGIRMFDFDLKADRGSAIDLHPAATDHPRDTQNHCGSWMMCLWGLRDWLDAHPGSGPFVVLVGEADLGLTTPGLHFQLDDLERMAVSALGRGRIISPADMRGEHPSLRAMIAAEGWPSVASTRGKVLLVLNDRGLPRERYIERGGEDPDDRLLFIIGDPQTVDGPGSRDDVVYTFEPGGRWVYETDPAHFEQMTALAEAGYLVHGISDDPALIAQMRAAGAHMIGTRYPDRLGPIAPTGPTVCNSVTAPAGCDPAQIEPAD